ncbi:hypothetical protein GOODEAATRI_011669 [Goodea atripinnis]|uniref:Uncharacterized protein n=1 Tax=Goodea atripinnis TaxID=208336 RepID=A0ABV0PX95_9TELE
MFTFSVRALMHSYSYFLIRYSCLMWYLVLMVFLHEYEIYCILVHIHNFQWKLDFYSSNFKRNLCVTMSQPNDISVQHMGLNCDSRPKQVICLKQCRLKHAAAKWRIITQERDQSFTLNHHLHVKAPKVLDTKGRDGRRSCSQSNEGLTEGGWSSLLHQPDPASSEGITMRIDCFLTSVNSCKL